MEAVGAVPLAQTLPAYREAVVTYLRGDFDSAAVAAHLIGPAEIPKQVKAFITEERHRPPLLRAALMLHTEIVLGLRPGGLRMPRDERQAHVNAQAALLGALEIPPRDPNTNPFLQAWYLLVIADAQGNLNLPTAKLTTVTARKSLGDYAELLLASGALEELAWTLQHEQQSQLGVNGDLKEAESAYRRALILNPKLIEAQLRLGRVLTLRDKPDDAVRALEQLRPDNTEGGFLYLARLFEGAAFEQQGQMDRAADSYRSAIAVMPASQSARVALAHLRHAVGHRPEAVDLVRELAGGAQRADDRADPWLWYIRGISWRVPAYLDWLRAMVKS
jgi:tetratricopeptide (TPR) repeat protein